MLKLPDGSILMHGTVPYDPAKAHAYYIKTRKLHPRQLATVTGIGKAGKKPTYTVKTGAGKTTTLSPQQLAEQKTYANHRVTQIKARLSTLNSELAKRIAKAKQGPTASDKTKAKAESKAYRDKHKQAIANKAKTAASKTTKSTTSKSGATKSSSKTETVASLKKEITQAKSNLKTAVSKQRELTAAKKNG